MYGIARFERILLHKQRQSDHGMKTHFKWAQSDQPVAFKRFPETCQFLRTHLLPAKCARHRSMNFRKTEHGRVNFSATFKPCIQGAASLLLEIPLNES